MTQLAIERDIVEKRLNGIQGELHELAQLAQINYDEFSAGHGYKLAQFHLHRALEGVFNIASHVLSRIPGKEVTTYKDIALGLGGVGIVDRNYASDVLYNMAGYRNRLVHFYAQVSSEEIYDILRNRLGGFDPFMRAMKNILEDPEQFGLKVE